MSENTNPQGSVDTSIRGAANAFMSFLEPQAEEAQAQPETSEQPITELVGDPEFEEQDVSAEEAVEQEEEVEELPRYRVKVSGLSEENPIFSGTAQGSRSRASKDSGSSKDKRNLCSKTPSHRAIATTAITR